MANIPVRIPGKPLLCVCEWGGAENATLTRREGQDVVSATVVCRRLGTTRSLLGSSRSYQVLRTEYSNVWASSQHCEERPVVWFCPSVCPNGTTRPPLDGISWNLVFEEFFENLWKKN